MALKCLCVMGQEDHWQGIVKVREGNIPFYWFGLQISLQRIVSRVISMSWWTVHDLSPVFGVGCSCCATISTDGDAIPGALQPNPTPIHVVLHPNLNSAVGALVCVRNRGQLEPSTRFDSPKGMRFSILLRCRGAHRITITGSHSFPRMASSDPGTCSVVGWTYLHSGRTNAHIPCIGSRSDIGRKRL